MKKAGDLIIPVIPLKELISYKKELGRNVDKRDVKALSVKSRKNIRVMSLLLFVFGIFFLINFRLQITGAFIGSFNAPSIFNLIFGLIFILISVIVFASKSLDEQLREIEKKAAENEEPIIIDTNFLIESCNTNKDYRRLMDFIQSNFDCGNPVIIPKGVYGELKVKGENGGEKNRKKELKEFLETHAFPMEEIDKKWENSREKYDNLAKNILQQTPKYLSYLYLSELNKGRSISVEDFLGRHPGKLSNAFSEKRYEQDMGNALRNYRTNNNPKKRENFLHTYDLSPADIEVKIVSNDSHLLDSLDILNKSHATRREKLDVLKKI
jgi:rRNA-processing protein FCF1